VSGSAGYIKQPRRLLTWLTWERSAVGARERRNSGRELMLSAIRGVHQCRLPR
jgi:hypothetical protein